MGNIRIENVFPPSTHQGDITGLTDVQQTVNTMHILPWGPYLLRGHVVRQGGGTRLLVTNKEGRDKRVVSVVLCISMVGDSREHFSTAAFIHFPSNIWLNREKGTEVYKDVNTQKCGNVQRKSVSGITNRIRYGDIPKRQYCLIEFLLPFDHLHQSARPPVTSHINKAFSPHSRRSPDTFSFFSV